MQIIIFYLLIKTTPSSSYLSPNITLYPKNPSTLPPTLFSPPAKMSEKYCDEHDSDSKSFLKKLFGFLLSLLILILFIIFLIWIILRPSRPRIVLQDATIYSLNLLNSPLNYLNATIQVTLACRNSNDRIGVLFQKLDVSAHYKNQQITLQTSLPTGYLRPNEDITWSPILYSVNAPIAPYVAAQLAAEQQTQVVMLRVKMIGRIKWKVGTWMSGVYHLYADCPAYIAFGSSRVGNVFGQEMKLELDARCGVEVGLGG